MVWGKRSWLDIWRLEIAGSEPACFLIRDTKNMKTHRKKASTSAFRCSMLSQGRGYGAVVVTMLMSQQLLVALNEAARGVGAAFVLGSQHRNGF